jgi:radical SAM protein with 4Fe4S-binding SPASM domain
MLALDPKYKLRKTKTNILFYRFDCDLLDLVDQKALHPNAAILLSFFNGKNSLGDIRSTAQYILELPDDKFVSAFDKFMEEWKPFMVDVPSQVRNDNPHEFVTPASIVDQGEIRCETPLYIGLLATQKCGRSCVYCYAEKEDSRPLGEMSFEQIAAIVEQAKAMKAEIITLGGGDPFVRPDVTEIIQSIIKSEINVQLSTKQFLSAKTIAKLKEIGVDRIQISVDCLSDDLAKRLTGVPNYASNALKTIERLQNSGITVTTNSVVTGLNVHDVPQLIDRLASMNIPIIRLSQYHRSAYNHSDELFVPEVEALRLKKLIDDFNTRNREGQVSFSTSYTDASQSWEERMDDFLQRPACSFARTSLMILSNGQVIPCEQLPCVEQFILGDATKQSLTEIWNSPRLNQFARPDRDCFRNTICYNCEHFDLCVLKKGWCIRDAWKAYNAIYQVHPFCPKSENVPGRKMF